MGYAAHFVSSFRRRPGEIPGLATMWTRPTPTGKVIDSFDTFGSTGRLTSVILALSVSEVTELSVPTVLPIFDLSVLLASDAYEFLGLLGVSKLASILRFAVDISVPSRFILWG